MDEARLEQACVDILAGRTAAVDVLAAHVGRQMTGLRAGKASLFLQAKVEPEDVAQHVLRKLLETPPTNPRQNADAVAVVLGWTRAVGLRFLLDRRRRAHGRDEPVDEDAPDSTRGADEELAARGEIARMHAHAKGLAGYKYLAETFAVLCTDPDINALELALKVGLLTPLAPGDDHAKWVRSGTAYAWKLKQRVLDHLADRMGAERRGDKR